MGKTYTIDESRLYKVFKKMVDYKFEDLSINKSPRWTPEHDEFELIDQNGNRFIIYSDNTFHVLRNFYWSFLEYMPISYKEVNDLFTKYFNERFPEISFRRVIEFDR